MFKRYFSTRIPLESHFVNEFCKYRVAKKTIKEIQKHLKTSFRYACETTQHTLCRAPVLSAVRQT